MSIVAAKRVPKAKSPETEWGRPLMGTLLSVSQEGVPFVDYPGNPFGPLQARVCGELVASARSPGTSIVVFLQDDDPGRPVILGAVSDRLPRGSIRSNRDHLRDVVIDGTRVEFEAQQEIVLRCGKSSITLTANGKVVIKGTELVSRASGANKIRGALVNIN